MSLDVRVDDVVQTRKPHACGQDRWRVYRMGADVGLRCLGCGRRVMLPRRKFERAVKRVIERSGPALDDSPPGDPLASTPEDDR